ncbi:MAG: pyridoxal phosphate-dependent aminotransferase [Phycisphaerae bacterium]|nr:pyridoxal phosphate-dependent aminotransferase [Phycisphaerae bacterium]
MTDYLAQRTRKIDASGIRKAFALAGTLQNPVNFSIGQPDFDVPDPIKEAAILAIQEGWNRYSQTSGDSRLLARVQEKVRQDTGWDNPLCMVTSGVSGGLLLAFLALVDPGDEVIIVDPYFVIYKQLTNLLDGRCVFVDSYPDFRLPIAQIAAAVTPKTKMIILNSPANPTGTVYTEKEVLAIAEIAKKHDLILLIDEIYDAFCYEQPNPCVGRFYEKTLLLRGFSKSAAMTGWRVGYAACSPILGPLMECMNIIQQYSFVCAPTPFQIAAITALDYDNRPYIQQYRQKRDRLVEGLKGYYTLQKPGGAFYLFVQKPDWAANASEFVKTAIENNVLIIPGNVFSEKDTHFRISYAAADRDIERGIDILRRLAKR